MNGSWRSQLSDVESAGFQLDRSPKRPHLLLRLSTGTVGEGTTRGRTTHHFSMINLCRRASRAERRRERGEKWEVALGVIKFGRQSRGRSRECEPLKLSRLFLRQLILRFGRARAGWRDSVDLGPRSSAPTCRGGRQCAGWPSGRRQILRKANEREFNFGARLAHASRSKSSGAEPSTI